MITYQPGRQSPDSRPAGNFRTGFQPRRPDFRSFIFLGHEIFNPSNSCFRTGLRTGFQTGFRTSTSKKIADEFLSTGPVNGPRTGLLIMPVGWKSHFQPSPAWIDDLSASKVFSRCILDGLRGTLRENSQPLSISLRAGRRGPIGRATLQSNFVWQLCRATLDSKFAEQIRITTL